MKQKFCKNCGADTFIVKNGFKVCKYCDSKYELEDEDKMEQKSEISLQNDIDRLLQMCKDNPWHARKYAGLILDIDPTNREAKKYL